MGDFDRTCRYLQRGAALPPATLWRLAFAAGRPSLGRSSAQSEPRTIDPHYRWYHRAASRQAKARNGVWRIHSAFDLPRERFGFFELTDEKGGERLDRIPVLAGEIR